jgi:hypothetical protein
MSRAKRKVPPGMGERGNPSFFSGEKKEAKKSLLGNVMNAVYGFLAQFSPIPT